MSDFKGNPTPTQCNRTFYGYDNITVDRPDPIDTLSAFSKDVVKHNLRWRLDIAQLGQTRCIWSGISMGQNVGKSNTQLAPFGMKVTPTGKTNLGFTQYLLEATDFSSEAI